MLTLTTLYVMHSGRCHYCQRDMTLRRDQPNSITRDHVVPRWLGGVRHVANIVAACYRCNQLKDKMTVAEFVAMWEGHWHDMPELDPRRPCQNMTLNRVRRAVAAQRICWADPAAVTLADIWPKEAP